MEFHQISGTDLNVSRIALGTWAIGGRDWGGTDEQDAIRTIQRALDLGINLIDTAPIYGHGRSEEIVAKALAGRSERAIVATKCGLEWGDYGIRRNSQPSRLRQEIEDSLRRLCTEAIDLYQVHWPDLQTPFEETAKVLEEMRGAGKVRALGVSNFSPEQTDAFCRAAPVHTTQPPYNLFERAIERDVLPYARRHAITTLMYSPLCRSLLSGRMRRDTVFSAGDIRSADPKFQRPRFQQYLDAVEALDRFARENYGKRVLHLAVRWILDQPGAHVVLWGARRPEQLDPVPEVFGWSLDAAALARIDEVVAEKVKDPVGPEFLAPPEAAA